MSFQVKQQHGGGNTLDPCSNAAENETHAVAPSGECKGKHNACLVAPPGECNTIHNKVFPLGWNVGKHRRKKPEERGEVGKNEDGDRASDGEPREMKTTQYERLWEVDPETASRLHPSNVRKIARALEVFDQHGVPMSCLLADQHGEEGGGALSGPLRYPNPCVIWVQCQQQERGLVDELSEFHHCYNQQRLGDDRDADYTLGIFQTIGFKEFHDYLLLSAEEKQTARGRKLLQEGVDNMKRATRRYARRQVKWITNRFLKRRGANVPSVYAVDASNAALWRDNVHEPAKAIISAYLQGEESAVDPLRQEENRNVPEYNVCDVCGGRIFTCLVDWQGVFY
ncbi:hypothetical protein NP493_479g02023 [Ridgeia piscesae]|uniref:tRNA isopentenyltransferase n=1 Tax=Ridgeia piscesae TaxID=27915 RepID=A0AAD9KYH0_RIDPI|nr:hypothetical protein NP493_479g02023 [Ridgeia piscesae]